MDDKSHDLALELLVALYAHLNAKMRRKSVTVALSQRFWFV